jgi:septum formation protein
LLILASRSPRRRAILEQLGVRFEVRPADVVEDERGEPAELVSANALRKARAIADQFGGRPVLGVDTAVFLERRFYGKPRDEREARAHLERLSGRTHEVWSAIALIDDGDERVETACTAVRLRRLDKRILDWYLATGEWRDRAGAYAIQGRGAALVHGIEGDYWNVVGLPVSLLIDVAPGLLVEAGLGG